MYIYIYHFSLADSRHPKGDHLLWLPPKQLLKLQTKLKSFELGEKHQVLKGLPDSSSWQAWKACGRWVWTTKALEAWALKPLKWWIASLFTRRLKTSQRRPLVVVATKAAAETANQAEVFWAWRKTSSAERLAWLFHSSLTWSIPLKRSHGALKQRSSERCQQFNASLCRITKMMQNQLRCNFLKIKLYGLNFGPPASPGNKLNILCCKIKMSRSGPA